MENLGLHNIERSVLATIFFNPDTFEDVSSVLQTKDFHDPFLKMIFEAMQKQHEAQKPIDPDLLLPLLSQNKIFNEEEFLSILALAPLVNLEFYLQEIRNASLKRSLYAMANNIAQSSQDQNKDAQEVLEEAERELYELSSHGELKDFRQSEEIVQSTLSLIQDIKARGNNLLIGLNTGFAELNRITTGFNPGELIIIGARPSMGKTTFVLNMVQKFLVSGKGVAFFSLEMQAEHLMLRMLSSSTSIPLQRLRVGDLSSEEWSNLSQTSDHTAKLPLYIDDNSFVSITQLRSKMRKLKSKQPDLGVCIVDYLQLMSGSKKGGGEAKRQEEISEISRGLKILARELEIPIIALSQLNRMLESRDDKRPQLSDLRESGAIEQDADIILFLYRDDVYRKREEKAKEEKARKENQEYKSQFVEREIEPAEIIVAKNRNGEVKTVKIQFNKKFIRFEEPSLEEERDYKTRYETSQEYVDMSAPDMPVIQ
ncbi:replicative DNA helicase [Helicobacter kayseriensis]|uniref:replicative DNA helicase n=1 Tax=Helicobacter kayseriensis TaxID=2905877 RepID=UPI001E28FD11|nr:replicative DNA helicase [Helicobacter kayseriensis]MCE3046826.1 replicative DNA helicase [Helicobacter kayseriensis]MCE3047872.1 replicative DNA helicase [Helicobacter kayseriensis]